MSKETIQLALEAIEDIRQLSFQLHDSEEALQAQKERLGGLDQDLANSRTIQTKMDKKSDQLTKRIEDMKQLLS